MQKLVFESAWDLTIAEGDRKNIKEIFTKTNLEDGTVHFTFLRRAKNYKGEHLITVLIHNTTNEDLSFQQPRTIICKIDGEEICEQQFSHRNLVVKAKTSMPWTFIFTPESIINSSKEIMLELKN